jgi:membrane protein
LSKTEIGACRQRRRAAVCVGGKCSNSAPCSRAFCYPGTRMAGLRCIGMPTTDASSRIGNPTPQGREGRIAAFFHIVRASVDGFIEDEALTRGGAIAFYVVTSIAPVLLIVVAIAGLVFGRDAAMGAIVSQFGDLMGHDSAKLLQTAVITAAEPTHGIIASILGIVTLLITASGVFGEMQSALNVIWKAKPKTGAISQLVRARAASLGLVAALGFLLMISLVVSTAVNALANYLNDILPFAHAALLILNFIISYALLALLFAAIYKVLPDRPLEWRQVIVGAMLTSLLFEIGKFLISFYLGSSSIASSYGAAGSLIILLLWVYYSAQLFLLGAEFTKAYAGRQQSDDARIRSEQTQSVTRFGDEKNTGQPRYGR